MGPLRGGRWSHPLTPADLLPLQFRESAPGSLGNRTLSDTYGDASGKVALGVVRGRDATAGSVEAYRLGMKNPYKH